MKYHDAQALVEIAKVYADVLATQSSHAYEPTTKIAIEDLLADVKQALRRILEAPGDEVLP